MDFVILTITTTTVDLMKVIVAIMIMKVGTKDARFHGIKE